MSRVRTRSLVAYVVLANLLAWLVCMPVWLDTRGLTSPLFLVCATAMMFTPTIATVLVLRVSEKRTWRELAATVGLGMGGTPGHLLIWLGLAALAVYIVTLGALVTSWLAGHYDADLGLSGLRQMLAAAPQPLPPSVPVELIAVLLVVGALANGVLNTIPALGEEIGWRGFLFPELQARLGGGRALIVSGVIWGLWHAPLILLGYNYPLHPVLGLFAFTVVCTLLTGVFAWVRQRSGSVWPAAYGHGLFNALAGGTLIAFQRAGSEVDTLHGTILGWSGWPIALVGVVVLVMLGAYAPRSARGPSMTATSGVK